MGETDWLHFVNNSRMWTGKVNDETGSGMTQTDQYIDSVDNSNKKNPLRLRLLQVVKITYDL